MSFFILPDFTLVQSPPLMQMNIAISTQTNMGFESQWREKGEVRGASKHGFRMGYGYVNASEDHELLQSNWLYLLGYELNQTIYGGDWINVLFVQNISVVGVNQSLFIPSVAS